MHSHTILGHSERLASTVAVGGSRRDAMPGPAPVYQNTYLSPLGLAHPLILYHGD